MINLEKRKPQLAPETQSTWYFTFGCGHELAGYVQPILANSMGAARAEMFRLHGSKWAFQYSQEQWTKLHTIPVGWIIETELPLIVVEVPNDTETNL